MGNLRPKSLGVPQQIQWLQYLHDALKEVPISTNIPPGKLNAKHAPPLAKAGKPGLNWPNIFWISMVHLVAIAAIPYFSWVNLGAAIFGLFVISPLGINIGYHRMLTHRGFTAKPWFRNTLVTIGAMQGGGPPIHWAAMHRVHHRYSDQDKDPHNSTKGFWYSHIMHLFVLDEHEEDGDHLKKYAPDLLADPYLNWLNKHWIWLALAVLPVLYAVGGVGLLLWGGFVRIVLMWHVMWFVNSASHIWGYRNYDTKDSTVNCWWVGLLAAGEGWHNNHHANPACAKHGHKWWEFDLSYVMIRGFEKIGLIANVKKPSKVLIRTEFTGPAEI